MTKRVSLKDIANELGVSTTLVSYVLNGKMTSRINPDTATRILELAKKLNYKPNQIAKSLKSNKTFTIGLIVADISNLFYSSIARYIEGEANNYGYNVLFGSAYEDIDRFKAIVDVFIAKQVDGLILALPAGGEKYLVDIKATGIPFVLLDREPAAEHSAAVVRIDNFKASQDVVHHLLINKYDRIGAVALKSDLLHLKARMDGFKDAIAKELGAEHGFVYEIPEAELEEKIESLVLKAIHIDKVNALYFFTNRIAMAGLSVLARYDIDIPQDLAIVCFDEADAYRIFKKELSYVKQPLQEMSQRAVQLVLGKVNFIQNVFFANLVVKESSLSVF